MFTLLQSLIELGVRNDRVRSKKTHKERRREANPYLLLKGTKTTPKSQFVTLTNTSKKKERKI